ncbi:histidine kinase [Mesorhizobium sp. Root552]|jgi:two-component sensor histidine kinase|uniref:sensor histidine kinase n=1 Tax=Mesorhizobium sp. Root552 TaxID=1736555 RepID=UPI0006F94D1B|nr:PAS domain-containing sensor histidine kinase [Mesorhizobium sp. Root552]KQZ33403.1 histidine kinase [Mesorhizobium sp. Root552]
MAAGRNKEPAEKLDSEVIDPSLKDDSQLGRALLHALRNAGVSVLYQDNDLRTVWARNMPAPWAVAGGHGDTILPPSQTDRIIAARRSAIASGQPDRFEISAPGEDGMRWFEVWVDPDVAKDGSVRGVMTTKVETTERKRREQSLRALLREVSHRSKNLLAIIQSIASQTGRYSETIADFLTRFQGRLQSLASSQDLVTSSNWRGAQLRELIYGQVGRYTNGNHNSLQFEGSNPYLNPNAALHIGLAIHELVVNSLGYGALSRPGGAVNVGSELMTEAGETRSLRLLWSEPFESDAELPTLRHFGRVTLERVVPLSLNGQASLDMSGGRLQYHLTVPHGNFETE